MVQSVNNKMMKQCHVFCYQTGLLLYTVGLVSEENLFARIVTTSIHYPGIPVKAKPIMQGVRCVSLMQTLRIKKSLSVGEGMEFF